MPNPVMPKLSVVIPVYNEALTIQECIERVIEACRGYPLEIVIVDDGSTDETKPILRRLVSGNPGIEDFVKIYHSPVNVGKGATLRVGFKLVTGDIAVIQDADMELDPVNIPRLTAPIVSGDADVVFGSRMKGDSKWRFMSWLANKALTFLTNILYGTRLTDMETGFKVFSSRVLDAIEFECNEFDIEPEMAAKMARMKFRIVEEPIDYRPKAYELGKLIGWKDGFDAVYTLFKYRKAPIESFTKSRDPSTPAESDSRTNRGGQCPST